MSTYGKPFLIGAVTAPFMLLYWLLVVPFLAVFWCSVTLIKFIATVLIGVAQTIGKSLEDDEEPDEVA